MYTLCIQKEKPVLQWALKLNSAPAAVESCYFKGCILVGEKKKKKERKNWNLLLICDDVSNTTHFKCSLNFHNCLLFSCIHAKQPHTVSDPMRAQQKIMTKATVSRLIILCEKSACELWNSNMIQLLTCAYFHSTVCQNPHSTRL